MNNREIASNSETPLERAQRAIGFVLNPFVGRRNQLEIDQHLETLEKCVCEMKANGDNPQDLFDAVEEISQRNGGIPPHKGKIAAKLIKVLLCQR